MIVNRSPNYWEVSLRRAVPRWVTQLRGSRDQPGVAGPKLSGASTAWIFGTGHSGPDGSSPSRLFYIPTGPAASPSSSRSLGTGSARPTRARRRFEAISLGSGNSQTDRSTHRRSKILQLRLFEAASTSYSTAISGGHPTANEIPKLFDIEPCVEGRHLSPGGGHPVRLRNLYRDDSRRGSSPGPSRRPHRPLEDRLMRRDHQPSFETASTTKSSGRRPANGHDCKRRSERRVRPQRHFRDGLTRPNTQNPRPPTSLRRAEPEKGR